MYISRMSSYFLWKHVLRTNPEDFPIKKMNSANGFRMTELTWHYDICPICSGYRVFEPEKVGLWKLPSQYQIYSERLYCLCAVLEWLHEMHVERLPFYTAHMPASLSKLRPINDPPEGRGDLEKLLKYLDRWLEFPDGWAIIQGGTGSAKTHILQSIATQLEDIALYISAERFQQLLFRNRTSPILDEMVQVMNTVPILLFDDWDLEHDSPWTTNMLAGIINTRYQYPMEYITILTTNIPLSELVNSPSVAKRRIISRMLDEKIASAFRLRQADYRLSMTKKGAR